MKLLISNQHGAIVMALLPFLYGMFLAPFDPISLLLLCAWIALYLTTYPFLNLFKGKKLTLYKKWTFIYGSISFLFALIPLYYHWQIIYFMLPMIPLVFINIYYVKHKDERALGNDFTAILIFALAGMGSYYFSANKFDINIWKVAIYPTIFFIGTTLYVKSVLRERKNPRYYQASILFNLVCIIIFLPWHNYYMACVFLPSFIRAYYLPKIKLSVKQVGLIEFAISFLFLSMLCLEPKVTSLIS